MFVGAVMEHIEEAGVHSGDSSCQIPPATLSDDELDEIEDITRRLARRLGRAWVAEPAARGEGRTDLGTRGEPARLANRAVRLQDHRGLAGTDRHACPGGAFARATLRPTGVLPADPHHYRHLPYTAVKAAVLPFGRFPGVDTVLGPEMKSTGEVMGIDRDSGMALAKAMVVERATALPPAGRSFVSVANRDKRAIVFPAKRLADMGFRLLATSGTAGVLERAGIPVERVAKVSRGSAQRGGARSAAARSTS